MWINWAEASDWSLKTSFVFVSPPSLHRWDFILIDSYPDPFVKVTSCWGGGVLSRSTEDGTSEVEAFYFRLLRLPVSRAFSGGSIPPSNRTFVCLFMVLGTAERPPIH